MMSFVFSLLFLLILFSIFIIPRNTDDVRVGELRFIALRYLAFSLPIWEGGGRFN